MSETKSAIFGAACVLACVGAVAGGLSLRESVDYGSGNRVDLAEKSRTQLVASNTDKISIPEDSYFFDLKRMLKAEYVEPISDEKKLVGGAVRGMVVSLGDLRSLFMDPEEFRVFKNARTGKYEGIGAELAFEYSGGKRVLETNKEEVRFPKLTVVALTPNGAAAKAGMKPGDTITGVNGYWVTNWDLFAKFDRARRDFEAKKTTLDAVNKIRKQLRTLLDKSVTPSKAKDKLMTGLTGKIQVEWESAGKILKAELEKAESKFPGYEVKQNTIRLPLLPGIDKELSKAMVGKPQLTIDLRNNVNGDFEVMRKVMALLAPKGVYGYLLNKRGAKVEPLEVKVSTRPAGTLPQKVTLLVDKTTRGAAEILAQALASKGAVTLSGSLTYGDSSLYDIVQLQDGSGYTLVTSEYSVTAPAVKGAKK